METFTLEVSYAQLAVFDSRLENPFNDWSEEHVQQGFSWRVGSVSFATLDQDGPVLVKVSRLPEDSLTHMGIERVIRVPFFVSDGSNVEIASVVGSSRFVALPPGNYALHFCHGRLPSGLMSAVLVFESVEQVTQASILRHDAALDPPESLLMKAEPA